MKIKLFSAALCIALSATVLSASAQKNYTEGTLTVSMTVMGNPIEAKEYFTIDSTATTLAFGPANVKILINTKHTYFAQVVDASAFNIKKAAVYTPDEIDQALSAFPTLTFTPGTETQQISGFNCKKVVATDTKTQKTFDMWVTNDITVPAGVVPDYLAKSGGFPVKYSSFFKGRNGQMVSSEVTVTGISDQKAPKGTFGIAPDFDRISKDDMDAMSRGGQ